MISRLLAGLVVAWAASGDGSAAEGQAKAKSGAIVVAAESADEKRLEWDDADPTPDKSKSSTEERGAAKTEDAKPAADKPAETAAKPNAPAPEPKSAEGPSSTKPGAIKADVDKPDASRRADAPAKPQAAPVAVKQPEPAKSGAATDAPRSTRVSTDKSAKGTTAARAERTPDTARQPKATRDGRDGASPDFATTRTTERGRGERVWVSPEDEPVVTRRETYGTSRRPLERTAQAARRPAALRNAPIAEEVAARAATPISGGILCGGGSKWRCNWIEREHNKFYKFTKGHGWTDQTMATDFCATERQMRVASATRIKSIEGGCCGFVIVQVTCKR